MLGTRNFFFFKVDPDLTTTILLPKKNIVFYDKFIIVLGFSNVLIAFRYPNSDPKFSTYLDPGNQSPQI